MQTCSEKLPETNYILLVTVTESTSTIRLSKTDYELARKEIAAKLDRVTNALRVQRICPVYKGKLGTVFTDKVSYEEAALVLQNDR